ncbi:MAG: acetate kinase, partial [Firmicutes bacterium]|nr:acetate kinase [Bacillota bacterium]
EGSVITHEKIGMDKVKNVVPMNDHKDAIEQVLAAVQNAEHGVVKSMDEIGAVGHRVVHAGEKFACSVKITEEVIKALEECVELAPLHNPPNLLGIEACQQLMPETPMVGVFDTAFHQTMPAESYIYAIPYEYYQKHGIRRYGFHGTSHKYVSERAAHMLNVSLDDLKLITCHLGNGASVSAIKRGKCIDTSMGFTPLEGLVMGTRSGDIDPAIVTFIREKENLPQGVANEILNKKSGVLGISGVSSDFRDIEEAVAEGNERAALALKVFAHKVRFYIGAYIAEMNGVDAIIFTAGVGENDVTMREVICHNLGNLGIKLDPVKNKVRGKETIISTDDSRVKILLIPTNEELMIARDTYNIVTGRM